MVKFCWKYKFDLTAFLISLDLAAIVGLSAVYTLDYQHSNLLCLVVPGLEDPTARAHLVPTFTFGETEVFDQELFQKGSRMYKFQNFFCRIFGFYFCVFYGQGFHQGSVGLFPYSRPIDTVVGEPLPLPQIEKPSHEMVDKYHALYVDALSKLFDKHKTQYGCSDSQKLLFL
ncbi:Acyl-CoA wax alcohol acyltransferase 1 [Heterocephalus glaber]|uniref:Acyl-CoA wax alcohol acyltransferase 1 n=1 Tax=Heterocephalus glaber TaxID=10181 RepID=G5BGC6_HETGA|nr:Acyl-CoA wax alcohol acyltransferase 1 [Heterocephalus glaber]